MKPEKESGVKKKSPNPSTHQTPHPEGEDIKPNNDHETFGNEPAIKEPTHKNHPDHYEVSRYLKQRLWH